MRVRLPIPYYLLVGAFLAVAGRAASNTIEVNTTLDNNLAPAGTCTLRDAVSSANSDTAVGGCKAGKGADKIKLEKDTTYVLSVPGKEDDNLTGDLDIWGELEIDGRGAIIDAGKIDRVMDVLAPRTSAPPSSPAAVTSVRLLSLTLTGGDNNKQSGGLRVLAGSVVGDQLVVTGNRVSGDFDSRGGGIFVYGGFFGAEPAASLTLHNSEISSNFASQSGGGLTCDPGGRPGVGSKCLLFNTVIRNNQAQVRGGGIHAQGGTEIVLDNCLVEGNYAATALSPLNTGSSRHGGGIHFWNPAGPEGGKLTITGTVFRGNVAARGGALNIENNNAAKPHTVSITQSTFSENIARRPGVNAYGEGGAIYATTRGDSILLSQSTLSDNRAGDPTAGGADAGGAIYTWDSKWTIANCTISGNHAYAGNAGGIVNVCVTGSAVMNILNSTITGNTATGTLGGAGVFAFDANPSGTVENRFVNTIVAGNTSNTGLPQNCATANGGILTSLGHNIDSRNECLFNMGSDRIDTDPLLGPLEDNGGTTWTHALLVGSLAIDAGDELAATDPPVNGVDQRGVPRPPASAKGATSTGLHADIGAYEYQIPKSAR